MVTIKINPIVVSTFGESEKTANEIVITSANPLFVDNGVAFTFHLNNVSETGSEVVFNDGKGTLTNEEVADWTSTDEQLFDAILLKLKLTRAVV